MLCNSDRGLVERDGLVSLELTLTHRPGADSVNIFCVTNPDGERGTRISRTANVSKVISYVVFVFIVHVF